MVDNNPKKFLTDINASHLPSFIENVKVGNRLSWN